MVHQQYRGYPRRLVMAALMILNPAWPGARAQSPTPDEDRAKIAHLARELRSDGVAVAALSLGTHEGRPVYVVRLDDRYQLPGLIVSRELVEALRASRDAIATPDGRLILSAHGINQIQGSVVRSRREEASSLVSDASGRLRLD